MARIGRIGELERPVFIVGAIDEALGGVERGLQAGHAVKWSGRNGRRQGGRGVGAGIGIGIWGWHQGPLCQREPNNRTQ